jgi:hypothetical protein
MTEIGKTGLRWSAGYIYDEFIASLRGSKGIKTYHEMEENDSIVGACMHAIKQILRESRWDVKPADDTQADTKKDAEFLEANMTGMQRSWNEFFTESLSFLTYGFSLFEQVHRYDKRWGRYMWDKFSPRVQRAHEKWDLDEHGETIGFWQRPAPDYKAFYIPMDKALHFRTEPHGANPEGKSILRNAYRSWWFKKVIEEIEGIGIERDLAGIPVMTMPEGLDPTSDDEEVTSQVADAKELIANIRRDEQDGILLPHGWEFTLLSSSGQRQFDTVSVINRYNKEIAVTVLGQFVMLGMERTGSYALAREQTDMFYQCLEGWADATATTINRHAVRKLFAYNGITEDMRPLPYIVHTPIRRFTLKDVAYYVEHLSGEKVNALEIDDGVKAFLRRYGRLEEYSEVRK